MGLEVSFRDSDGTDTFPLATANGWKLVCDWLELLPGSEFPQLRALAVRGESLDSRALSLELGRMPAPLDADAQHTLEQLRNLLGVGDEGETVTVHSGEEDG